jgi:hypothetical protein
VLDVLVRVKHVKDGGVDEDLRPDLRGRPGLINTKRVEERSIDD